jgi:hypothetical protein
VPNGNNREKKQPEIDRTDGPIRGDDREAERKSRQLVRRATGDLKADDPSR